LSSTKLSSELLLIEATSTRLLRVLLLQLLLELRLLLESELALETDDTIE
jgi:hypothetical protein